MKKDRKKNAVRILLVEPIKGLIIHSIQVNSTILLKLFNDILGDFSARTQQKSSWSSLGPSQLDSSLLNNIQKLFSERIDLSGAVEPNKSSIVMAVIKICLKVNKELEYFLFFSRYQIELIFVL